MAIDDFYINRPVSSGNVFSSRLLGGMPSYAKPSKNLGRGKRGSAATPTMSKKTRKRAAALIVKKNKKSSRVGKSIFSSKKTSGAGGRVGGGGGSSKPKTTKPKTTTAAAPATAGSLQFVPDVNRAKAAQNAVRSAMADRGMLNSTMYGSASGEAAATDARNQFLEQEAIRQYNVNQAMRAYEMLTAKTLQEAQIRGGFEGLSSQYPNQPTYWSYLQQYMPPEYKPTAAHMGDAPSGPANQPWTGFAPNPGKTLGGKQLDASIAEANARIALQRRQVDIAAEQWKMQKAAMEKAASEDTTWQAMADAAATNYQWVDDGTGTGGLKKIGSMTPEAMINAFRAKYGVDVERIATDPSNPNMERARAIYKILYYKTGQKRLDLYDQGVPWDQARTLDIRGNYVGKPAAGGTAPEPAPSGGFFQSQQPYGQTKPAINITPRVFQPYKGYAKYSDYIKSIRGQ